MIVVRLERLVATEPVECLACKAVIAPGERYWAFVVGVGERQTEAGQHCEACHDRL